jgi:hypothetical protein
MKNNIDFYPHFTNSHEHWKFELLRAKYDWQGEGIFWALNNMIGSSENTILCLKNKSKKASIAGKFKMSLDEFEEYLQYLATDCELIIYRNGDVTTDIVSNVLENVTEKRRKERERMESWRKQKQSNADVTRDNADVTSIKESKVKESKVDIEEGALMEGFETDPSKAELESYKPVEVAIKLYRGFKIAFEDNRTLKEKTRKEWIPPIRKLIEKRKYTQEQIFEITQWAITDGNFWRKNVMDTISLEKNFERLKEEYKDAQRKQA